MVPSKLLRVEEILRRSWDKDKYNARYRQTRMRNLPMGVPYEYALFGRSHHRLVFGGSGQGSGFAGSGFRVKVISRIGTFWI